LRRDQSAFLVLFLALYATNAAGELFLLTGGYRWAPHLAGAQLPLKTLLGPAIYFYTRAMTAKSPRPLLRRDAIALAAPLLVLIAASPFYMLTGAEKLALADPQTRDPATFAVALTSGARPEWASIAATFADLAFTSVFALCGVVQRSAYEPGASGAEPAPYARSGLNEERMVRIAAKLEAALVAERLFENPDLSLRLLSDHLGVSENYLSETFSRHLNTSFFDYVNARRVEEARRRLTETADSVLAIAHAVGFNSRSTFNAAFRKHVGVTPSAYRQLGKDTGGGVAEAPVS
jgi:AraC-like DNA-binding protein